STGKAGLPCNLRNTRSSATSDVGEKPSNPSASKVSEISRTLMAKNPVVSNDFASGKIPSVDNRSKVGLKPTAPHSAAGTRIDPAVSVPTATGTMPRATAAADPELEPPATRDSSCGFGTTP